MGKLLRKLLNNENWNIGFVNGLTAEKLLQSGKLPKVKWMRHGYKDRAFADPHILCEEGECLTILCEEIIFGRKGRISRLLVKKGTYELIDSKVLLELPTHLSYPAIIEEDGDIYIYPENSESGQIRKYRYNPESELLEDSGMLADGDLADFTICDRQIGDKWFALCTRLQTDSYENAYLYCSGSKLGIYTPVNTEPVVKSRSCSRPGGNFFSVGKEIYRPAQDCTLRYGWALRIMHVKSFMPYEEEEVMMIKPRSFKYYRGIHTLNFGKKVAVTDGYGHLYPIVGVIARILAPVNRLRLSISQPRS